MTVRTVPVPSRTRWLATGFCVMLGCTGCLPSAASEPVRFTPSERAMILSHGPWPQQQGRDPSNRFSGNGAAIRFGRALFSDARLSGGGDLSCASCHRPDRAMTDGLPRARGRALLDRNTPPIANLADRRWYGWTGQADTLWGQSIRPMLNPLEMAAAPELLARRVILSPDLARSYRRIVGRPPSAESPESILVNIGKMLSAWQETLVTPATPFDRFRDALARGEDVPADQFSASARRGLKFFVGEGRCSLCHFGPGFSNDEFHHIGLLHFVDGDRVDPGRHGGLDRYLRSPYTRAGPHSDEPPRSAAGAPGNFVSRNPDDWGRFRVPSLRNVAATAPYMHDGSLADLAQVVGHYNEIDMERLHATGETLLRPMGLDAAR
ncbi:MAG: hypothetical protein OXI10_09265, partial [Gammaproteobacteria bacterium]|nr:hypothetical protein [Gammaproteobacteria bacterium]